MRIRSVKPEFWQHKMHRKISEPAALLALSLLSLADDEGRFEVDYDRIKSLLFTYRALSKPLPECMTELTQKGVEWVTLYQGVVDGETVALGQVTKFTQHQYICRPQKSRLPGPRSVSAHGAITDDSVSAHGAITTPSNERSVSAPAMVSAGLDRKGMDRRGGERAREGSSSTEEGESSVEIPTLEEMTAALPDLLPGSVRSYYNFRTERRDWLVNGRLRDWKYGARVWANEDRARGYNGSKKKTPPFHAEVEMDDLKAKIQFEKDPDKKAELQQRLENLREAMR